MIGDEIPYVYTTGIEGYDKLLDIMDKKAMRDTTWEQLNVYLLLRGADQAKYGSVNKGIAT